MGLDKKEIKLELVQSLKILQADVVTGYFQIHGYHWNVEGMLFPEMHAKFLEIYEDVYESIDDISEMLRKLNTPAPFQLDQFIENRRINTMYAGNSPKDQIESFLMSNEIIIDDLRNAHKAAEEVGQIGIASDLEIREAMHQKWNWQLTSTIKSIIS
jgi:starvation-inducible DNA-binding protein